MTRPLYFLATVVFASPILGQVPALQERPAKKDRCTVCRHDPKLMKKNGTHHSPGLFARTNPDQIEEDFFWKPIWLETPHFRIGADLSPWKIPTEERKAFRAELTVLAKTWPKVNTKATTLDSWTRVHLLGARLEALYQQVIDLFGADMDLFADPEKLLLRGIGPFLGEEDKYEVMVFQERSLYREFMSVTWGLPYVKPQQWNIVDRNCLWFGLSTETDDIHHDLHLNNVIFHGLAHNLLNGYYYYAYELPVWLIEGLAHWLERDADPRWSSFCTVEGAFHEGRSLKKWEPAVRKIASQDKEDGLANLMRKGSLAELSWENHLEAWSKIDFFVKVKPRAFAQFITALASRRNASGLPDGTKMEEAQRQALRDHYGWSVLQAERAWKAWVLENYALK